MRDYPDPLHAAVMRAARPPRCLRAVDLGGTEAGNDIPLPVPHWGLHTGDLDHTASAHLVGDASDHSPDPYRAGFLAGLRWRWIWFASGAVFGGAVIGVVHGLLNRLG